MPDPQYPTQFPGPANPLATVSEFANVQNALTQGRLLQQEIPIRQQQAAQAQMESQRQAAGIRMQQILASHYDPVTQTIDYNAGIMEGAKDPVAAPGIGDAMIAREVHNAKTQSGINAQGQPTFAGAQEVAAGFNPSGQPLAAAGQQPPTNLNQQQPPAQGGIAPGSLRGSIMTMPMGYDTNLQNQQTYYNNTTAKADTAKTENAALSNILDLSKSNAPTGQVVGSFYTWLTQHNLAPAGAENATDQLQLMKDHAAQIVTAGGGSRSDQDQFAKELAGANVEDIPKALQTMIPYLMGNRDMAIAQAAYLHNQDPTGANPKTIANARTFFQQHSDPRIWELSRLQQSDPAAFKSRLQTLTPTEKTELAQHSKALDGAGMLGGNSGGQ